METKLHQLRWLRGWRSPNYKRDLELLQQHTRILEKRFEMLIQVLQMPVLAQPAAMGEEGSSMADSGLGDSGVVDLGFDTLGIIQMGDGSGWFPSSNPPSPSREV
eukprot:TRINITY_DN19907_c0_g3_i1.p1 TRINITY_DN19907_c0_g3~~TRINITY_DN19907_c0_g3_i1.p1  ORF type:complete len:105 (+),score=18.37 TRINITY_DN19907_c0_g3_i1:218-532(+)